MNPIVLHHDLIKQLVSVVEKMEMLILLHFDCKMSLVSLHVQNTVNIVYNSTIFTKKVSLPNFSIHSHVNIVIQM